MFDSYQVAWRLCRRGGYSTVLFVAVQFRLSNCKKPGRWEIKELVEVPTTSGSNIFLHYQHIPVVPNLDIRFDYFSGMIGWTWLNSKPMRGHSFHISGLVIHHQVRLFCQIAVITLGGERLALPEKCIMRDFLGNAWQFPFLSAWPYHIIPPMFLMQDPRRLKNSALFGQVMKCNDCSNYACIMP